MFFPGGVLGDGSRVHVKGGGRQLQVVARALLVLVWFGGKEVARFPVVHGDVGVLAHDPLNSNLVHWVLQLQFPCPCSRSPVGSVCVRGVRGVRVCHSA